MMYLVPLGATVLVVGAARTPPSWRPPLVITGVLAALMLLSPPLRNVTEEEGTFGVMRPVSRSRLTGGPSSGGSASGRAR